MGRTGGLAACTLTSLSLFPVRTALSHTPFGLAFPKVCLADVGMKEIAALASLTCVIPPTAGSALQGLHRTYTAELLYEYESPANPLHVVNYKVSSTNVGRESLAGWRMEGDTPMWRNLGSGEPRLPQWRMPKQGQEPL